MDVLVLSLNFFPEIVGIGRYSSEMAHWLAKRGHCVTVLTAPPYYPQWCIQPPYRNRFSHELQGGLQVKRAPLWVPRHPSGLKRLFHLASFAFSTSVLLLRELSRPPQCLIVIAPAFFTTLPALIYRFVCRLRGFQLICWLHIQDFELDAAYELGLLRQPLLRRCAEAAERFILRRFDVVSTLSNAMATKLRRKGVPDASIRLFPNWVNSKDFDSSQTKDAPRACQMLRAELAIPSGATVALYSGSMGRKQGLELLAEAASSLRDDPSIWWIFCGQGPAARQLEQRCCELTQVRFLPLQPEPRFRSLLQLADLHLLPQQAGAADLVMPSKLMAMLASGRPVVATAAADTELARVLQGDPPTGLVTPPGDVGGLADAVRTLSNNPDLRRRLGDAAHAVARQRWDRDAVLSRFELELLQLASASPLQWISGWRQQSVGI